MGPEGRQSSLRLGKGMDAEPRGYLEVEVNPVSVRHDVCIVGLDECGGQCALERQAQ